MGKKNPIRRGWKYSGLESQRRGPARHANSGGRLAAAKGKKSGGTSGAAKLVLFLWNRGFQLANRSKKKATALGEKEINLGRKLPKGGEEGGGW